MRARGRLGRIAGAGAALAIPFLPKCPMCVLPLAAAAGIVLPRGPGVEVAIDGVVAVWLATVLATARWLPVRLFAAVAAAAILGGRWLEAGWLAAGGCSLMFAVMLWTWRRARACGARWPFRQIRSVPRSDPVNRTRMGIVGRGPAEGAGLKPGRGAW